MITCKEATQLVSRSIDGPIPVYTGFKLKLHLLICKGCLAYEKQLRFIHLLLHNHPEPGNLPDKTLTEAEKSGMKDAIRTKMGH